MKLTLIFATDKNGLFGISRLSKSELPWSCPEDLKHFNRITTDSFSETYIVMGRKTFESLPKKLDRRIHVVLSSKEVRGADFTFKTVKEMIDTLGTKENKNIFIIGGTQLLEDIYVNYKNLIDAIYYTQIQTEVQVSNEDYPVYFPTSLLNKMLEEGKGEKEFMQCERSNAIFYKLPIPLHEEYQYLDLLRTCVRDGSFRKTRNASTYSTFNKTISFDLKQGFPLLTTKKVFMRGIFEELLFFLQGKTDSKVLEAKGVNIWKPNTTQEFISSCGLPYEEGDMGPMYGWNWKHFGAEYTDKNTDYEGKGFNQIEYAMELLRKDPFSRRILMTTYNPATAKKGVLYPCHSLVIQFYVKERVEENSESTFYVSMNMYQRSVDLACGLPFNIASNALLLHLICDTLNMQIGENKYFPDIMNIILGDIHVYEEHVEGVLEQITRIPYSFPQIFIKKAHKNIEEYSFEDIEIQNYISHPAIKYKMIA